MANPRTKAKIEARIRERAAYCIEFELSDPRSSFITVTRVEITNDLGSAQIFYTVFGTPGEKSRAAHMLEDANGFIRKQVGRVLKTRRIPRLTWIYDDSIEIAERMDESISSALQRDREINPSAHTELSKRGQDETDEVEREVEDFLEAREEDEGV